MFNNVNLETIRNIEPEPGEIELGGEEIVGLPHDPYIFRHSNRRRHLFRIRDSHVTVKNAIIDWNMENYQEFSTLFRFDSQETLQEINLINCLFVNTQQTQRPPRQGDCWCINFTNAGGLDGVTVEGCDSQWPNCQLTAGGKCPPDRGVYCIRIRRNTCYGGRANSIAVTGWGGQIIHDVAIEQNRNRFGAVGCFVGRDGPAHRGDMRLSNVYLRDNVFEMDAGAIQAVIDAGEWLPRFPMCALIKGGTKTPVRNIHSAGNVFDTRNCMDWQHPRWLQVSSLPTDETQVYSDDMRIGSGLDVIYNVNVQYSRQQVKPEWRVKRN